MGVASTRPRKPSLPKVGHDRLSEIRQVRLSEIRPAPENDKLYKPVLQTDPAIIALSVSIRQHGLREPLVLSRDGFILSGHRRYAACQLARLREAPVRYEDVAHDDPQFLVLLREYNRQRVKSIDEQLREAVVDVDPDEARAELVQYRRDLSKVDHVRLSLGDERKRKRISRPTEALANAVLDILEHRRAFWPLTDRQIHYGLLNNPPLKHSSKPDSRYTNDKASYSKLTDLLTRMRIAGRIPFAAIADATRPYTSWRVHREPGEFVSKEIDGFLKGYFRNLMQSQPNHVEVVVEKNTVAGIVEPVCGEFCIPMTSGRGYCSLSPRGDMAKRYRESGKEQLVLLLVSDFDPEGESIAESFARSMRDDFHVAKIHPIKVALTAQQIAERHLPAKLEAKATSSRTRGFVEKHGKNVWELEALEPEALQEIVRDAIKSVIDLDLFNQESRAEAADAVKLKAIRLSVQDALQDVDFDGIGGDATE